MSLGDPFYQFKRPIQTVAELELPPPDPNFKGGQPVDMRSGDRYHLFDRKCRGFGDFTFLRWQDDVSGRRLGELRQVGTAESLFLYECQVIELEKHGRIVAMGGRRHETRHMPGGVHSLTSDEIAEAMRRIEYVDALNREKDLRRRDTLPDVIKARVAAEVAQRRGEPEPSKGWLCKLMRIEKHGTALNRIVKFAPERSRGNTEPRFASVLYIVKGKAMVDALTSKMGAADARNRVKELVKEGAEFAWARSQVLDSDGQPVMKMASFQKGIAKLDRFTKDSLRIGHEYAGREHSRSVRSWRPSGILDVVDVDHSTLPINVYDPIFPSLAYGRPDILIFRDRYSGIVLGYSIAFSAPSFETFVSGFRHAIFPKDHLSSAVSWPWFGKPKRIGVDLAAHLTGEQMQRASAMLEFEITEYRPRVPEDKGALEHLFSVLDLGVLQSVPGHMPRPAKRKRLDFDEQQIKAEISIVELRWILDEFFANHMNRTPRRGIGELPAMKAISADIWDQQIRNLPPRGLVDSQAFEWLAGETKNVTIQDDGIQFDYLTYQSEELLLVTTNSQHQRGVRDDRGRVHRSTSYVASRPFDDIGHIWLMDHHRGNQPIRVPVDPSLASYANGVNAEQHSKVVEFKNEQLAQHQQDLSFQQAYERLRNIQIDFHTSTRRAENSRKIARHIEKQGLKIERAKTVDLTWVDSGGRTSLAEPTTIEIRDPVSPRAFRRPGASSSAPSAAPPSMIIYPKTRAGASEVAAPAKEPKSSNRLSLAELRQKKARQDTSKED